MSFSIKWLAFKNVTYFLASHIKFHFLYSYIFIILVMDYVVTWIFSFLQLTQKTNQKPRIRHPDLTKEQSDIKIGNENGVVGQPDRIWSLPKDGRRQKSRPDCVESDAGMTGPEKVMMSRQGSWDCIRTNLLILTSFSFSLTLSALSAPFAVPLSVT